MLLTVRSRASSATFALLLVLLTRTASAATLEVGPGKPYATPCAAIAAAQAGDTIEADAAGDYTDDTCTWTTDALTVRGVNGRAKINLATVMPSQSKGIFNIQPPGTTATIENFELSGAAIPTGGRPGDANGAGIRHQATSLTVRNCYFHDNQNGILGSPNTNSTGTVTIEGSEFAHNGFGDGYTHNVYLGEYASMTVTSSYSHDAVAGHLYKSRADVNFVLYNRFTDENGTASYELDLPQGGTSYVIGNLIEQSATTSNPNMIAYGEENEDDPDQHLYVVNNTFVNDASGASDTFVWLQGAHSVGYLANNVFAGPGAVSTGATPTSSHNWNGAIADAKLVDAAAFDYQLAAGSPAIDMGAAPMSAGTQSLAPVSEYVTVGSLVARTTTGSALDIGAYEYGDPLDGGATSTADDGGGATGGGGSGDAGGSGGGTGGGSDGGSSGGSGTSGADGGATKSTADGGSTSSTDDSSGCSCAVGPGDASWGSDALGGLALLGLVFGTTRRKRR
jgi:MYXO-CTERM domain-containing protein